MSEPGAEELSMEPGHQVIYINENTLILDGDDEVQYVLGDGAASGGDMQLVQEDGTQVAHYLVEPQNLEQLQDKDHIVIQQAGYAEMQGNAEEQVLEGEEHQMFSIGEDEELGEVTQVVLSEEQCRMLQGCGRVLLQEGNRRFVLDGDGLRELDPIVDEAELQSLEYILPDDNNESVTLVPYNGCKLMPQEYESEDVNHEDNTTAESGQKDNMETDLEDIIEHCAVQMDADEQDATEENNEIVYIQNDCGIETLNVRIEDQNVQEDVHQETAGNAQHREDVSQNQKPYENNACVNNFGNTDGDGENTIISVKLQKIKCHKIYKKIVLMPDFAKNDYPRISAPTNIPKKIVTNFQTECTPKKTRNLQRQNESKINKKIFIGRTQDGKSLYGRIVAITPSITSKTLTRNPILHDSESNDSTSADNPCEVTMPLNFAGDGEKNIDNLVEIARSAVRSDNAFVKTEKNNSLKNFGCSIKTDKMSPDLREVQAKSVKRSFPEVKSKKVSGNLSQPAKKATKIIKKADFGGDSKKVILDNKAEIVKVDKDADKILKVIKKEKSDDVSSDVRVISTITPKVEGPLILNSRLQSDEESNKTSSITDSSMIFVHNSTGNKDASKQDSNEVSYRLDLEGDLQSEDITPEQGELLSLTNILSTLMKMPNLTVPLSTRDLMVLKQEADQERIFVGRMLNLDEAGPADWNFMFMPELCKDYMGETCEKEVLLKNGNFLVVKLGKSTGGNACEVVIMDRAKAADANEKLWERSQFSVSFTQFLKDSKARNFRKSCPVCKKVFYRMSNLSRHLTIHAVQEGADGESTGGHSCSFCRCAFRFPSTLTRHILECHTDTNTANVRQYSLL